MDEQYVQEHSLTEWAAEAALTLVNGIPLSNPGTICL
jgi:hypothetical protein